MLRDPHPRWLELGHLVPILRDGLLEAYLRWAVEARDDFVVWAGPVPHVVVVRPESVREVLGAGPYARNIAPTAALFGGGLLRLEGAPWRARRHLFAPPFRGEALDGAVAIVQAETDRLIAAWGGRPGAFRPARDLSFAMLRILGRWLFGFDFDEARHGGPPLHRALVTLATNSVLRHLLPRPLVWTMHGRAVRSARRFLDGLCAEVLAGAADTPFMAALRGAVRRRELDHATAVDELRSFLIAGHETTATAIAWTVAVLAMRPELVPAVRAEAEAAAAARTADDVAGLAATVRLVKEVMRLYPPVPISVSVATEDTQLGRIRVRRGTRIDVCSYVLHRLPWLWPEPGTIDPERFRATPAPGTWFPFLLGPHTCLGMRLALIELPLVAARLAGAFELTLPEGPPRPNLRLSLHPAGLTIAARAR